MDWSEADRCAVERADSAAMRAASGAGPSMSASMGDGMMSAESSMQVSWDARGGAGCAGCPIRDVRYLCAAPEIGCLKGFPAGHTSCVETAQRVEVTDEHVDRE